MKNFILSFFTFLIFSSTGYSYGTEKDFQDEAKAYVKSIRAEISSNKELRKSVFRIGDSAAARENLKSFFSSFFNTELGYTEHYRRHVDTNLIVFGLQQGNESSRSEMYRVGLGAGLSWNEGMIFCTFRPDHDPSAIQHSFNVGFATQIILGFGYGVGAYVGTSGVCIKVESGIGLNVSAGAELLTTPYYWGE
jgi:hypothetical protein